MKYSSLFIYLFLKTLFFLQTDSCIISLQLGILQFKVLIKNKNSKPSYVHVQHFHNFIDSFGKGYVLQLSYFNFMVLRDGIF